jgi:hypothetical protein
MGSRLVGSDLLTLHRLKPTVPLRHCKYIPTPDKTEFFQTAASE